MPGRILANAPNVVMPTTVASQTVPTGYSFLRISHGLSSCLLVAQGDLAVLAVKALDINLNGVADVDNFARDA